MKICKSAVLKGFKSMLSDEINTHHLCTIDKAIYKYRGLKPI